MSTYWKKIGAIRGVPPALTPEMLALPIVEANTHSHLDVVTEHPIFWFKREWTSLLTLSGDIVDEYINKLNLCAFEYKSASILMAVDNQEWHIDEFRPAAINIAIHNSSSGKTEFLEDSTYTMNDGDVYCLDTTHKHRMVIEDRDAVPRIILSISLYHDFNSVESQNIFNNIERHLSR